MSFREHDAESTRETNDLVARIIRLNIVKRDCIVQVALYYMVLCVKEMYVLCLFQIHLSFSLYGTEKDENKPAQLQSDVLNLFLQSVGIVLTDIQDVIFK